MTAPAMKTYLIEPKAPLVVRSGRPFDDQSGADPARFPPPSTLAGALRSAHARHRGREYGPWLGEIAVAGPLAARLDANGEPTQLLVPRPADAAYLWTRDAAGQRVARLVRAAPQPPAHGEGCDLPDGLWPVMLTESVQGKPAAGPRWWAWTDLLAWHGTAELPPDFAGDVTSNGWTPPDDEIRTHVGIDARSGAAETGKLFQTAGLCFWQRPQDAKDRPEGASGLPPFQVGLIGCLAGDIGPGLLTLGGERRLSALREAPAALWPQRPQHLVADIRRAGGLSLTLLTPALFRRGWRPQLDGLQLRAAALERWQPHSGWDLAKQQPRAGRKLVPAGAVYWFKLDDGISDDALAALWLAPVSDDAQDSLDGFGLAVPQPWTPDPQPHRHPPEGPAA